jgi:hypothetical protein
MMKSYEQIARHEAAHFVLAWAVGNPQPYVDITPAAQKLCDNNPNEIILGKTFGSAGGSPFEHILSDLAGPVADYWAQGNDALLEGEKVFIEQALAAIANNECLDQDDGDWEHCLREMAEYGFDVLDHKSLNDALSLFLDAVRETLKLCEGEWQEATAYLVEHGRIGWNGGHWDSGEGSEEFFFRWGGDYGEPPQKARAEIDKLLASKR